MRDKLLKCNKLTYLLHQTIYEAILQSADLENCVSSGGLPMGG